MAGIYQVYTVVARSSFFFGGEGKGKIHIHGVICDDNDDDDVWHIEALRKTNLIRARRALRRCNAGRKGIMMTYVNETTPIDWLYTS